MQDTFRVALIGCGKRGHAAAKGAAADPRCQVVALVDPNEEAAKGLAEAFGFQGARHFAKHQDMLEQVRPEVVLASLWTPLHLPVFRDCAAAGVRAFHSEKPMAPSWAEAHEMGVIARESGCQLTFCHQRRFYEGNITLKRLLNEGVLGELKAMDLYSPCGLLDCGTHTLDLALSFNRETPAKWVMGALDLSEVTRSFDVPTETMATGTIVFENGVRAHMQCKGPDRDLGTGTRIHATGGMVELDWNGNPKRAHLYEDPDWRFPFGQTATKEEAGQAVAEAVIRDTLDALAEQREPELSYVKALRASEIIFALYQSACEHRRIELPLPLESNAFAEQFASQKAST